MPPPDTAKRISVKTRLCGSSSSTGYGGTVPTHGHAKPRVPAVYVQTTTRARDSGRKRSQYNGEADYKKSSYSDSGKSSYKDSQYDSKVCIMGVTTQVCTHMGSV